ncbi:hypothetical protein [Streptomyces sp. NPDC051572]|uniref:hypothetical protein n=1 Tax=Streptomyces sp. NPDC051572 TaxID=3155802 RepID=UPI003450F178
MRKSLHRASTVALSLALVSGTAAALAPTASAATSSTCTYNITDYGATVDGNGVNYRNGPGTTYYSKGLLYTGDRLKVICGKGNWYYSQLTRRSKSHLASGTHGWIRKDMLATLAG